MNNKGFTLIEALVAIAIFIGISTALAQIISVSIQNQVNVVATQNALTQASFAIDKIGKELRMAQDEAGNCFDEEGSYKIEGSSITFLHLDQEDNEVCKTFKLDNGKIKECIDNTEVDITGDAIEIEALNFFISDNNDNPRITISIETKDGLLLQTTVSQRKNIK
ncbi:MAG: PulJ/GspJ family protein [Minisyncoccales bacterium]|jgi:prepilin-type N-terminal cleavage/methylation domain-containing protein|nr:prepilin-type N-terminal cleavage/methylation domain-containing protein [Candidatus Paceibacterota bacterium]NMB47360.1 prepilin-type N-terminal cleavage/methylation domain-containing protein [Patescibacteria group bacterium]